MLDRKYHNMHFSEDLWLTLDNVYLFWRDSPRWSGTPHPRGFQITHNNTRGRSPLDEILGNVKSQNNIYSVS